MPFSICFYLKCSYNDKLSEFYQYPQQLAYKINYIYKNPLPMQALSQDEIISFNRSSHCDICQKPFLPGDLRSKDHSHLNGKYCGPSHISCNVNYSDVRCKAVFLHNLFGEMVILILKL